MRSTLTPERRAEIEASAFHACWESRSDKLPEDIAIMRELLAALAEAERERDAYKATLEQIAACSQDDELAGLPVYLACERLQEARGE